MDNIYLSQTEYQVHFQKSRELFTRISIYNSSMKKIDEIQGVVIDGNVSMKIDSPVRRTASIRLLIKDDSYLLGENKRIWLDKFIKLEIGIKNVIDDSTVYFNLGYYCINSPKLRYDSVSKELNLELLDFACNLDGTLNGVLKNKVIIPINTPISTAIKSVASSLGNVTNMNIESNTTLTPYEIDVELGDTVWSLLSKIQELYMDWDLYFNEDGYLVYEKIKNKINDTPVFVFEENNYDIKQSIDVDYKIDNVKNSIYVYGMVNSDKSQIKYTLQNTNSDSPFCISKLGEKVLTVNDEKIQSVESAKARATYELIKHNNFCETINLSCVPLYFLKVNQVVEISVSDIEISGKYLINSISYGLDCDSTMNLSLSKIYDMSSIL